MKPYCESHETNVAGVTFGNRQKMIQQSNVGDLVDLIPEPRNKHDKNACKVVVKKKQIGYLNSEFAAVYARKKARKCGLQSRSFVESVRWFDEASILVASITVVEWSDDFDATEAKTTFEKLRSEAISREQARPSSRTPKRTLMRFVKTMFYRTVLAILVLVVLLGIIGNLVGQK